MSSAQSLSNQRGGGEGADDVIQSKKHSVLCAQGSGMVDSEVLTTGQG